MISYLFSTYLPTFSLPITIVQIFLSYTDHCAEVWGSLGALAIEKVILQLYYGLKLATVLNLFNVLMAGMDLG